MVKVVKVSVHLGRVISDGDFGSYRFELGSYGEVEEGETPKKARAKLKKLLQAEMDAEEELVVKQIKRAQRAKER